MSYGTIGTGLGAPVGGATSTLGGLSNSTGQAATGGFDIGSTLSSNLLLSGVGKILAGTGQLLQSASGLGTTSYSPSTSTSSLGQGSNIDFSKLGQNTGLPNLGNQGTSTGLDSIITQLNSLVSQLSAMVKANPAPAPQQQQAPAAPAPQFDPIANLVNRANVDPQLRPAVTQVAQDPVGNKLLEGAVNDGLKGIEVANMPAGFFGQVLPETKQLQIAPQTVGGNDLVRTIGHELVHAATLRDGDSIREENVADQIGTQIQQRITGLGPGYVLGGDAYNGLPQDNGIANSLRLLGITI